MMENTEEFRGQVLVAIMNNPPDFVIARDRHWYRIPVYSANKMLKGRWPPDWLAFYQTKIFGSEAYSVRYYARVLDTRQVSRRQLFPDEPHSEKSDKRYYQLILSPLKQLPQPIFSRRWRRIVFIPTTWHKFINAAEINDLYDDSPLEDRLWAELKRWEITAERQYHISAKNRYYVLDFAVFCDQGKIDVEANGDTWHADPDRIPLDNQRNNDLESLGGVVWWPTPPHGWSVLRFNGKQIREKAAEYCIPKIKETINRKGGLTTGGIIPHKFDIDHPEVQQLTLF